MSKRKTAAQMIYHYTAACNVPFILAEGLLPSPNRFSGGASLYPGEKQINWFTTNDAWENTTYIQTGPTFSKACAWLAEVRKTVPARIVCKDGVAPMRWHDLKERMYITPLLKEVARALYVSAIVVGARPGEWRATYEVIPVSKFERIEVWDGSAWVLR